MKTAISETIEPTIAVTENGKQDAHAETSSKKSGSSTAPHSLSTPQEDYSQVFSVSNLSDQIPLPGVNDRQPVAQQAPECNASAPEYGQSAVPEYGMQQEAPEYGQSAVPEYGMQQEVLSADGQQQAPEYGFGAQPEYSQYTKGQSSF